MNGLVSKYKYLVLVCFFCFTINNLLAQKLANKQQTGLHPQGKIKIDGKATEWGSNFQAYNNATEVFYTMANDDENIYLVIKAVDEIAIRKILSGGLTFSISPTGKKSDGNAAITYPVFNFNNKPDIKFSIKSVPADSIDYLVASNNKKFTTQSKFIRVAGIKGLDSLVSVYNTDGLTVASRFDNDMSYTYEVSLSRKLIEFAINPAGKFYYSVTINPIKMDDIPGVTVKRDASGTIIGIDIKKDRLSQNIGESISSPTDFSAEYTLIK